MIGKLFNNTKLTEKSLNATWLRNEAISQNLANVDTPGYKRKSVSFEEQLNEATAGLKGIRTDRRHIPIGQQDIDSVEIKVVQDNKSLNMRIDGNNVDIDSEMALMAKNTIQYNTLVQTLNGTFGKLRSVITEGRR